MNVQDKDGSIWEVKQRVGNQFFLEHFETGYPRQVDLEEFKEEFTEMLEASKALVSVPNVLTKWTYRENGSLIEHTVIAGNRDDAYDRAIERSERSITLIYTEDFIHE